MFNNSENNKESKQKIRYLQQAILKLSSRLGYKVEMWHDGDFLGFNPDYNLSPTTQTEFKVYRAIKDKQYQEVCTSIGDIRNDFRMLLDHLNLTIEESGKRIVKK